MCEKIKAAAIKRSDGVISTHISHCAIISHSPEGTCKEGSSQGFITTTGRFVDRKEAAEIALSSGQISKSEDNFLMLKPFFK